MNRENCAQTKSQARQTATVAATSRRASSDRERSKIASVGKMATDMERGARIGGGNGEGDRAKRRSPATRAGLFLDQFYGGGSNSTADDQYLARTGAGAPQLKW